MSIVGFLLGRFGLPRWAQEAIVIVAALGVLWAVLAWHDHKVYVRGIAAQQAADKAASAVIERQAAIATQAAQDAANRAEESYREEIASNAARAAAHPLGPVRLCIDAHVGGVSVPETSGAHSGNESAGTGAGRVQQVPSGDSGVRPGRGPDISGLLRLLGERGDTVSATLREFQSRGNP